MPYHSMVSMLLVINIIKMYVKETVSYRKGEIFVW